MAEPNNFSAEEQFQDINKKIANKIVRAYFKDIAALENDLDLTTSRQALLKACLHKEGDTLLLTIGRNQLFNQYTSYATDQYPIIAGSLLSEIDATITYKPKITLFFQEDAEDAEVGYSPHRMEVSWRLINETTSTVTRAKLTTIANKIKAVFGSGNGYVFKKGRKMVRYRQIIKGYDFKLRSKELAEAKRLITDVLAIQGDTLDRTILKTSEVDNEIDAFPYNPGRQNILGKQINKPRRRPLVNVRFRYAYVIVHGRGKPIYLYSRAILSSETLVQ